MWNIIILASLAVLLTAEDTLNVHSPCSILLNKVSLNKPAFVEVGKFCGDKENTQEPLAGYYIVVVEKESLVLRFFKSLQNNKIRRITPAERVSTDHPSGHKDEVRNAGSATTKTSGITVSSHKGEFGEADGATRGNTETAILGQKDAVRHTANAAALVEARCSHPCPEYNFDQICTWKSSGNFRQSKVSPAPKTSIPKEIEPSKPAVTQAKEHGLSKAGIESGQLKQVQPMTASQLLQASKAGKAMGPNLQSAGSQGLSVDPSKAGTSSASSVVPSSGGTRVGILRRPANRGELASPPYVMATDATNFSSSL